MKKIVICEGKHDGFFIKNVLEKLQFSNTEFKIFNQDQVDIKKKKFAETNIMRGFINQYNPNKILVKQEGGKNSAIPIFCSNLVYCLENVSLVLILDLDEEDVSKRISYIKKITEDIMKTATPIVINFEIKNKNNHLHHILGIVNKNKVYTNQEIGEFQIIFFKNSLEYSCNIPKDEPISDDEKKIRIEEFINKENICDFLSTIFI